MLFFLLLFFLFLFFFFFFFFFYFFLDYLEFVPTSSFSVSFSLSRGVPFRFLIISFGVGMVVCTLQAWNLASWKAREVVSDNDHVKHPSTTQVHPDGRARGTDGKNLRLSHRLANFILEIEDNGLTRRVGGYFKTIGGSAGGELMRAS